MDFPTKLSIILGISSIILGVLSIILSIILAVYSSKESKKSEQRATEAYDRAKDFYEQAGIFNKETRKALDDIKIISVQQVKIMDYIQKGVYTMKNDSSKLLNLSKDRIELQKLSLFNKDDIKDIMETLSHLDSKNHLLKEIEDFLKGEESIYKCDFGSAAKGDKEISITEVYNILLKYNLYVHIAPE